MISTIPPIFVMPWMSVSHIQKELAYFNYCFWALVSTGSLVSTCVKPFFFLNIPLSSKILCFVTYNNIENLVKISNYGLWNRPNVHSGNKIIIHFENFNQLVGLVMGLMSSSISFFFFFFFFNFFFYICRSLALLLWTLLWSLSRNAR